jgi:uncharacterized protein (DUF302 family)
MKHLLLILTVFAFTMCTATGQQLPQDSSVITKASSYNMDQTLSRLKESIKGMGINLVAEVDHAKAAADNGLELRPTHLLIFGNPMIGTNLMQADQRSGLDLPLRLLVWEDAQGKVNLSYRLPQHLQKDFKLQEQKPVLDKMDKVYEKLTEVVSK